MNNEFLKKAAAVMTAASMLGTTAFAAVSIKDPASGGINYDSAAKKLTVKYDGVDASQQASLLVYNITSMLQSLAADDVQSYVDQTSTPIVAINQVAAADPFEFSEVLPDSVKSGDKLAIKVGATGESAPAATVFEVPEAVVDDNVNYGDVDGNGSVNGIDVTYVLSEFQGKLTEYPNGITAEQFTKIADVDGNGSVNGIDVTYVLSKFQGKLDKFPIEEGGTGGDGGGTDTPTETP